MLGDVIVQVRHSFGETLGLRRAELLALFGGIADFIVIRIDDADRYRLFGQLCQLLVCHRAQALFGQWATVACDAHGVITRYIHVAHSWAIVKLVLHRIRQCFPDG